MLITTKTLLGRASVALQPQKQTRRLLSPLFAPSLLSTFLPLSPIVTSIHAGGFTVETMTTISSIPVGQIGNGLSKEWLGRSVCKSEVLRGVNEVSFGRMTASVRAEASAKRPDERRQGQAKKKSRVGAGGGLTYKDAGVDIDAGSELVRRIAALTPGIGGFGGLFPYGDSYLVAGTDGVGTKLKLAFELNTHDTIGIDLVAMSVNDIITSGAKPLFFLDYFATSHLDVDQAEQVIKGIVDGCRQSDCVLLGGETAEMPDFYAEGEYDLSGFAVGSVKKDALIDGKSIMVGDQIIGLASSGVHSNGFSLVRRVLAKSGASLQDPLPGADGISIGEALLAPTVIYVKQVLELVSQGGVKGIAHITGGGFTENIPRIFPSGLGAFVKVGAWTIPPIFKWLQTAGGVEDAEMLKTFNMGVGMILVVTKDAANEILSTQTNATRLGHVVEGEGVTYGR